MSKDYYTLFPFLYGYDETDIKPVVKWAGGKRQLSSSILKYKPGVFTRYIEPFAGALAILFALRPPTAIINDINPEIIDVYKVIRRDVELLIEKLSEHQLNDGVAYYYQIRNLDRLPDFNVLSSVDKAARTIYLNKTCFNGLYRVNSKSQFNVPRGNEVSRRIFDVDNLRAVSTYFNDNEILMLSGDFEKVLDYAYEGDFIYLDPPYDVINKTSFVSYFDAGFNRDDQCRLFKRYKELSSRGCKAIMSNSSTPFILDLYKEYRIEMVEASRFISASANSRQKITEVLILNY